MGLGDILAKYNLGTKETPERIELLMDALRRKPGYSDALKKYAKQDGGADTSDFVGPKLASFVEAVKENPEIFRTMLASLYSVVFLLDSAEHLPGVGSILGASMDIMIMGGKVLTKTVQSAIPPMMGLLPIPYASTVGLVMAAVFGMIAWPMIALISLSRQDFAVAMDAYVRAIPPPFGDMLANTFTEGNRTVAKIDSKRVQLGEDLVAAFKLLSEATKDISADAKEGLKTLTEQTATAAAMATAKATEARSRLSEAASKKAPSMMSRLSEASKSAVPSVSKLPDAASLPDLPKVSMLDKLRSQKTKFASPSQLKGGFNRRTRRKSWRPRTTQRRSVRR